ncbi:MAG: SpoIIIAH-like family protein [Bacillota bacterium]
MARYKKALWFGLILVLCGATFWVISGLDTELQEYEVLPDDELLTIGPLNETREKGDWVYDQGGVFFVEYRLQRDRIRAQEVEMLEDVLNNPNTSTEAKVEAETLLLEIVQLMEQELLIENVLKAQGFDDAVFFFRNRVATVMIKKGELSEREFIQVTETVAGIIGIEREEVQVIARP